MPQSKRKQGSLGPGMKKRKTQKKGKLEPLQIRADAAGIDVGATELYVAVPPEKDANPVRTFETFTRDLHALADWLEQCGVRTVAMESTGVYWIPVFQVLEERGLEVCLVNAQHLKNVPGRKTDVADCQWIQQVHSLGLLNGSFRPPQQVCAVRSLLRHKAGLIEMSSQQILLMQKALDQMNLQLHHVLSDITGSSGLAILDAILAGERNPATLAELRDRRVKASAETIIKALEGDYRAEHLFTLQQSLKLYRFLQAQITDCQRRIREEIAAWEGKVDVEEKPVPAASKRIKAEGLSEAEAEGVRAECYRVLGVDLTQVDGINAHCIQVLTAEVGTDLGRFRSAAAFASWMGLSPKPEISGGKVLKNRTAKNRNRVAGAFRMAANSLLKSQSPLGDCFRRLRTKLGAPKAITAMAHKLARIVYHLITNREAFDPQIFAQQQQQQLERRQARLRREAAAMGYSLTPCASLAG
jgi:transposase